VRTLDRLQPLALLVLRLVLGVIMIAHGYPKVTGFSHFQQMITGMGLPGGLAYLSAAAEFLGGILVLIGLFTRCAAFAILIDLSVAIWKVHWKVGLLGDKGYQFPLSLGHCFRADFLWRRSDVAGQCPARRLGWRGHEEIKVVVRNRKGPVVLGLP
jgi:putative oxidoreductase